MRIFILEDDTEERTPTFRRKLVGHELVFAETAQQAINILGSEKDPETRKSRFDLIFLDHDLGGLQMVGSEGANTGSAVVRWMMQEMGECPPVVIHSLNTVEAIAMQNNLQYIGIEAHRIPWTDLKTRLGQPGFIT